nr:uncharacterized protein BN887_01141 [Melanopsichium pennsylvanicum 4]
MDSARQNIEGSGADRRDSTIKPFGLFNDAGEESENSAAASGSADRENDYGMSITLPNNGGFGAASSYLPSDLMSPGLVSPPAPTSHPGRIQIPATNFVNSFGAALQDQMSPMIARMQVPMTPGMPGFTFHQVPETPPLYPQFLSPGLGPFSPVAGGNTTQMAMAPQDVNAGGFMNAAPGAPLGANFNPMFPASYGQGMQNQQPPTPHWSQIPGQRRGDRGGGSGANRQSSGMSNSARDEDDEVVSSVHTNIAKTPGAGPRRPSHADASNGLPARRASDVTPGSAPVEPSDGYPFPIVSTNNPLAHLTRRASMDSPAGTPLAGPGGSCSKAGEVPPSCGAGSEMLGTSTEELANTIARLSVKGTALTKDASGAAARRSLSMTAERSAAASAMAKLRERAGTPTPPAVDEESAIAANAAAAEGTGLGAPFSGGGGIKGKASPLAFSQVNAAKFLGLKGISEKALEVARNGSALDTRSEAGEGSKSGTPQDEHGAHQ